MPTAIDNLIALLDLEPLEVNLFRGLSPNVGWQRVFGGQVIGQALVAASRTIEDRPAHSMHGYFMRPGDPKVPIIYQVERLRDGRSFSTRHVVAIQHGKAIFSMSASFHKNEPGFEHQEKMPDVPPPEDLAGDEELRAAMVASGTLPEQVRRYWLRERPIELRPLRLRDPVNPEKGEPTQAVWIRATGPLPDNIALHQCVLAYASDFTLLDTALIPHGRWILDPSVQSASLDHAMWLHRPFRADDWLLYVQTSTNANGARGFARGSVFDRGGTLVASVAQEGLIRDRSGD
ncbi:Acyl-CoA thioesterase II [hydrothermal vent metagenome]|uniref:Acyl-CoA thioesterase II n=1 Tax=hydrothermal vent metagenome TaxID=652676 RepID=A0A3B0TKY7_9ZZZZ